MGIKFTTLFYDYKLHLFPDVCSAQFLHFKSIPSFFKNKSDKVENLRFMRFSRDFEVILSHRKQLYCPKLSKGLSETLKLFFSVFLQRKKPSSKLFRLNLINRSKDIQKNVPKKNKLSQSACETSRNRKIPFICFLQRKKSILIKIYLFPNWFLKSESVFKIIDNFFSERNPKIVFEPYLRSAFQTKQKKNHNRSIR